MQVTHSDDFISHAVIGGGKTVAEEHKSEDTAPDTAPDTTPSITDDQWKAIDALRDAGFLVIIWTPDELGDVDVDKADEYITAYGNDYIEGQP